ncbi:phosphatidylinositol glycan anchor biosynthesis class U protein [Teleopsis dalmanni]|uniref:phosphatidylinositol glycan anchor biosynthesis class U protein n=1 Tax=Teleopsis dalmanni TaxID=139649 RepID=UPI0018CDA846|nr:phosphatidylinositol glycan anchor biosynthesis class U protein [Teleopsis dalmanni]
MKMQMKVLLLFIGGGILRYLFSTSRIAKPFIERNEISTPLNAFKRVQEGIYLHKNGIDPYTGDIVHETPVVLLALGNIVTKAPELVPLLYIFLDLFTAFILYNASKNYIRKKYLEQLEEESKYAPDADELKLHLQDEELIPFYVLLAYLFNPMSVLSCSALTSAVFSNLLLALTLWCLNKHLFLPCLVLLSLETMRNLYPIVLLSPIIMVFANRSKYKAIGIVLLFGIFFFGVMLLNYSIMKSWNFLDGTLGFIFFYRDLQPNIGLFWYFFTEMFEHFRIMFLITFQMNATVLYLIPLTMKMRKEPFLLATILIALISIFRSYPCLGDVGLYLALLPLWRTCWKFMAHKFLVFCMVLVTLSLLPALWYLWIHAGSANANFYFGVTLALSSGQIFLITDLLFAYVKRQFCLYNGQDVYIDGVEANIKLE